MTGSWDSLKEVLPVPDVGEIFPPFSVPCWPYTPGSPAAELVPALGRRDCLPALVKPRASPFI